MLRMKEADNLPSIQLFLHLFGLTLESKDEIEKDKTLKIYQDGIEVGTVKLKEQEMEIESILTCGILFCKAQYADIFTMKDKESENGFYANWNNRFTFSLKKWNNCMWTGDIYFLMKMDNEYGNYAKLKGNLQYVDCEKKYNIHFFENGYPFQLYVQRGCLKEMFKYSLGNSYEKRPYIQYWKFDQFESMKEQHKYFENIYLLDSWNHCNNLCIVSRKGMDDNVIVHDCREFKPLLTDECCKNELIFKVNTLNDIFPTIKNKIRALLQEFGAEERSLLEQLFLYSFQQYSQEEMEALFGMDSGGFDLGKQYFTQNSDMQQKIFTLYSKL